MLDTYIKYMAFFIGFIIPVVWCWGLRLLHLLPVRLRKNAIRR